MINRINRVNFVTAPMFKASLKAEETKPETEQEAISFKGTEALASYNAPVLNKLEKLENIKPIELIDTSDVEGEEIYTSDGKLYSIIKEDENTKTEYFTDDDEEIQFVVMTDKKTGNIIKEQDMNDDSIFVNEYSPETGKSVGMTEYKNNVPVYASQTKYKQDGTVGTIIRDFEGNTYDAYESSPDNKISRSAKFDGNKKLTYISETKHTKTKTYDFDARFYNGAMISIRRSEEIMVPNSLGKEDISNSDLLPAPKYETTDDAKNAKGEKTYYSNGALEKNVTENGIKAYFKPDGTLTEVETADKDFKFKNKSQIIEEDLEDGREKTTVYYENGEIEVELKDENSKQTVNYDKNGNVVYFSRSTFDKNGEETSYKSLEFNETGMLKNVFSY